MLYKKEALDFLGITRWHELGYKGKGIKFMSDERVTEKNHPDVIVPTGFVDKNSHGDDVMSHIKLVAPEGEFISYPFAGVFNGSENYDSKTANYIIENKVHIFTTSKTGGYPPAGKQKAIQDCISAGCIFFGCAGNEDKGGIRDEIKYEGFYAIGGAKPQFNGTSFDWSVIKKTSSSSVGKELDFVTIAEIIGPTGTSFCSPIFAGMIGLVQEFFTKKVGRRLTRDEMFKFILDHCQDLDEEGFDNKTGYGILILPEPSTIDIEKYTGGNYVEEDSNVINTAELQIDNKTYIINGEPKDYDVAPFIKSGRTFVPVRFLEDIGFDIKWVEESQTVIINKKD